MHRFYASGFQPSLHSCLFAAACIVFRLHLFRSSPMIRPSTSVLAQYRVLCSLETCVHTVHGELALYISRVAYFALHATLGNFKNGARIHNALPLSYTVEADEG